MESQSNISKAIFGALGYSTQQVVDIPQGESNRVYKVKTNNGFILFRAPKSRKESHIEKLVWVEKALTKQSIPHAKLLYATADSTLFAYGFSIFEYIENTSSRDAILSGKTTLEEFHTELGQLLQNVHAITFPAFGNIPLVLENSNDDFVVYNSKEVQRILSKVEGLETDFPKNIAPLVCAKLETLHSLKPKLKPVLCHTDPAPNNCVWNEQMGTVLIDWDDARATSWVADLADLTYSGSHLNELGPREERRKRILTSFLDGHGLGDFSYNEVLQVEHIMHILKAVHHLPYYHEEQHNLEWFWKTKNRLLELLEM